MSRHGRAGRAAPPGLVGWLLLSLAVAVVAAGLGLVFFAAFALPGQLDDDGPVERLAQLALALGVPVAGMVAALTADAAVRLASRRERPPTLLSPVLALIAAGVAFVGWAALHFA